MPLHSLRAGRPARQGGHRHPLRTALHRPLRLPPVVRRTRGTAAALQPHLQPVPLPRQQRGELAEVRKIRQEHAVALALQPQQRHQSGLDRGVPQRGTLLRADLRQGALQRHGMERRRGGAQAHQERHGQPAGEHGVHAAPQHRGLPDALLGGHARQRRRLPRRGEFLHVHRAGGLPLHRGDQLPQLALALRHQDGRPPHGQAPTSGHLRPAHEARRHHQPQQVRARSLGQRQVVLHEPPRAPVLRAGHARGARGHGQLLSGALRDDTAQNRRGGRRLLHLHGREAHLVQPFLHRRLRLRRGEEGQHQDAAAHAVEERESGSLQDRVRRAGQRRVRLCGADTRRQERHALLQHLLRVHERHLPAGAGGTRHQGGEVRLQHRQLPHHAPAVLPRRTLRLPAQFGGEHRPALQALHRLRDRQHQGEPRTLPRGDHHHHGGVHRQDAAAQRRTQAAHRGRGVEGALLGEHGRIPALHVQDGEKILRRGHRGDAGGGRHHLLARGQGVYHQQLRLQDTA